MLFPRRRESTDQSLSCAQALQFSLDGIQSPQQRGIDFLRRLLSLCATRSQQRDSKRRRHGK
jgi:hypothetical protein